MCLYFILLPLQLQFSALNGQIYTLKEIPNYPDIMTVDEGRNINRSVN